MGCALSGFDAIKGHRHAKLIGIIVLAMALIALPFALTSAGTAWVRITNLAILFILLSLGLNIVVGFAGLLDLGYIAFFAVGAYVYALLASPHFNIHLPFWLILPIGALVACLFGVLLGAPTLKLRGDYLAVVTLGFGEIIRVFLNNLDHPVNITNGPKGLSGIDPFSFFGVSMGKPFAIGGFELSSVSMYYYLFLSLVLLSILMSHRLADSRVGRAWMAIREDEIAAKAMGIHTRNLKLLAFGMGASFGGVSGALFASFQRFVSPESFTLMESVMIVAMVVLGGLGHLPGVVLGALLLAALPEVLRYVASPLQDFSGGRLDASILRQLLIALAMIVVMLLRPRGLWPSPERGKSMASRL